MTKDLIKSYYNGLIISGGIITIIGIIQAGVMPQLSRLYLGIISLILGVIIQLFAINKFPKKTKQ